MHIKDPSSLKPFDLLELLIKAGKELGSRKGLRFFHSNNAAVLGGVTAAGAFTGTTYEIGPDEEILFLYLTFRAQSNGQLATLTAAGGDLLEWNIHLGAPKNNLLRAENRIPTGATVGQPAPGPWNDAWRGAFDYMGTPGSSIQRIEGFIPVLKTFRGGQLQVGLTAWRGYTGTEVWNCIISAVGLEL